MIFKRKRLGRDFSRSTASDKPSRSGGNLSHGQVPSHDRSTRHRKSSCESRDGGSSPSFSPRAGR
jgi:hypothetical protein